MTDRSTASVSLGEAAYHRLRSDIVSCRLPPGHRLTEKQLVADTGFGTSPLRAALTRLDHDGLVRTLPRKGYQVSPLTPRSIEDLLDVWQLVGPEVVGRGIAGATPEVRRRAVAGFDELDRLSHEPPGVGAALRIVEVMEQTFALLADATRNDYLISLNRRLAGDLARVWVLVLSTDPAAAALDLPDSWSQAILGDPDPEAVAERSRTYLVQFRRRLLLVVSRWPSVLRSEVVLPPVHP